MVTRQSGEELISRLRISIRGAVQGVGFRPFVYRLASGLGINGCVLNSPQGVLIEAEGRRAVLEEFAARVVKEKPERSYIQGMETSYLDPVGFTNFEIRESGQNGEKSAVVLPDIATCPECISEIFDPSNRRYLYPFTNCTNCGPRFSIVRALPYDRSSTTMDSFEMCDECRSEYENPADRRFHAQPNACPKCGPHLELWDDSGKLLNDHHEALLRAAEAIRAGKIVGLKGLGGFQLIVDARNDDAIRRLRARKHREEKPFAVMYPSLDLVKQTCEVSDSEERLLLSPEAPIVLLKRLLLSNVNDSDYSINLNGAQTSVTLGSSVAPQNPYVGIMLPYSPLHHILMRELGFPIVATSGNVTDEPICIDELEAVKRLRGVADLFLIHNRPIERQVDDSVVRVMAGRTQVVRRARGYAPFPVETEMSTGASVLAVGGHLKNTIALNAGNNVFVSQHIGDLSTSEAYRAFEKATADFRKLFDKSPAVIVHDLHPDYLSTKHALKMVGAQVEVQHHHAHVAACMAENRLDGQVLGVSWDGTGMGTDGTVWGGEFLLTDGASCERVATFRPFRLPGSSASVREPRRTALGVLYEILGEKAFELTYLAPLLAFDPRSLALLKRMLNTGLNSPVTTSVGRLFDAVSSITGIRQIVNFEGQGAMGLEFAADGVKCEDVYDFDVVARDDQGTGGKRWESEGNFGTCSLPNLIVDWEPMMREIIEEASAHAEAGKISARFHNTLPEIIVDISKRIGEEKVVLAGGCFQNKYLTERTIDRLRAEGFKPYWHQCVPTNDGGISLGQVFVAMKRIGGGIAANNGKIEERHVLHEKEEAGF